MGPLVMFLVFIGLISLTAIINGWALSILWGWFFVPVLHLPSISIPQAIGISLVVSFLTHQYRKTEQKDNYEEIMYAFVKPVTALVIGYIVKSFL